MRGLLAFPLALLLTGEPAAAAWRIDALALDCSARAAIPAVPCTRGPAVVNRSEADSQPPAQAQDAVLRDPSAVASAELLRSGLPQHPAVLPLPRQIAPGLAPGDTRVLLLALAVLGLLALSYAVLLNRRLRWSQHRLEAEAREGRIALERAQQHQAALAQALRVGTMGELAAGLAHELNQPLAAIVNYAQGSVRRLQNGAIEPKQLLTPLVDITRQAERAADIVRHVRQLVRRGEPQCVAAEINEIVCAAARQAQLESGAARLRFELRLGANLPQVFVDPIQIEQAVLHIVSNAIEAAAETGRADGRVAVATGRNAAGWVEVTVEDNGGGFDPARSTDLCSPFYTTKPGRMGMGLAISHTVVESHQGKLCASLVQGGGAVFSFTLPPAPRTEAA